MLQEKINKIIIWFESINVDKKSYLAECLLAISQWIRKKIKCDLFDYYLPQLSSEIQEEIWFLRNNFFLNFEFMYLTKSEKNINRILKLLYWDPFKAIEVDIILLWSILNKTKTLRECNYVLSDDKFNNIVADNYLLGVVLNRTESLKECHEVLSYKRFENIGQYNLVILNTVLKKTDSLKECIEVLSYKWFESIKQFDVITLNTILNKTKSLWECIAILNSEIFSNIKVNVFTLNSVLNKTETFDQCKEIKNSDRFWYTPFNIISLNIIINKIVEDISLAPDKKEAIILETLNRIYREFYTDIDLEILINTISKHKCPSVDFMENLELKYPEIYKDIYLRKISYEAVSPRNEFQNIIEDPDLSHEVNVWNISLKLALALEEKWDRDLIRSAIKGSISQSMIWSMIRGGFWDRF